MLTGSGYLEGGIFMLRHKRAMLLLFCVITISRAATLMAFQNQGHDKSKEKKEAVVLRRQDQTVLPPTEQEIADQLPVADATAPEPTDPDKRAKKQKKGKRYDNSGSEPIKEAPYPYQRTWSTYWWKGLPAIPTAQSDVVLIGEITDAQAYLSNDKTGIYSEFTIRAGEVLKNDGEASLYPGSIITAERFGGAVRFASGAIQRYTTSNQRMPLTGRHYVLFLKRTDQEQDFSLITGYELRGQRVVPLDGANTDEGEKLPFDNYKGMDASSFLNILRHAISN
jgi:hypothetical protein